MFILNNNMQKQFEPYLNFQWLNDNDIIDISTYEEIERLHKLFIFCPLNKAAINYGIVYKKFYLMNVMKEIGLIGNDVSIN